MPPTLEQLKRAGIAWENTPDGFAGFEDLAFLFRSDARNRKVIRLDFDEAAALYHCAKCCHSGVEIGRFMGGTTLLLATALDRLLSIDIAPAGDEQLLPVLWRANGVVELITGDSKTYDGHSGPFDMVFIDGDHTYEGVRADHNIWGARIRPGGFIIHHDMGASRPGASTVADLARLKQEIVKRQGLTIVEEVGSLVVFKRGETWTTL